MPDATLVEAARRFGERLVRAFVEGTDRAIVVKAAAGAGKSAIVVENTGAAAEAGLRVAVTAPTNDQVAELTRRCAERFPRVQFTHLHATSVTPPEANSRLPNVTTTTNAVQASNARVVLATNDKFAYSADDIGAFERLVLDEAYQADSVRYLCVSGLAPVHLLVGDSGQLDPFSTVDCSYWRGQPEDPLATAVGVLMRNHAATRTETMPLSRRLAPSAVQIVQPAFYGPALPFQAASLDDEREIRIAVGSDTRWRRGRAVDAALERVVAGGWAHLELASVPVLVADPETAEVIAATVRRLFERDPRVRCERTPHWRSLRRDQVAVVVSHNDQLGLLRNLLDRAGLRDVTVSTANKVQGLEFDVIVAWHPLAGLPDLDEFHLDPGRLCVMLTRHRHGCIVVGRAGDREHVRYQPPTTPAYLGWDPDPVLDGWDAHRVVFEALEPHVVAV